MEGDSSFNKGEAVYVSHIEDAVTFWGQSMSRAQDISELSDSLATLCPTMSTVFGPLDLDKVYGGLFSSDKCWYRCKLLNVVSDEQCAVSYIDYGNSEILASSSIVELPDEFQVPPIAQKYRLWGLQLQTTSDIEQGSTFLTQLVGEKEVSVQQKAVYKDGTAVVQVLYDSLDIGEEVAKKGFAVRCRPIGSPNGVLETADVSVHFPWQSKSMERPPMREPKALPVFAHCVSGSNKEHFGKINFQSPRSPFSDPKNVRSDQRWMEESKQLMEENKQLKDESKQLKEESKRLMDEGKRLMDDSKQLKEENLQLKEEKKQMLDECGQLKEHKEGLCHKLVALELRIQKTELENKNEKEHFEQRIKDLELCLKSAAGSKLKALAAKIQVLKRLRCENSNMTTADDLLEAVKAVRQGQLSAPSSLNVLEDNWKEYSMAQEIIRECSDVVELDLIIERRNKLKEQLNCSVDAFVIEVDQMPFESRLANLQVLLKSLEVVYGASCDCEDSDAVFQEFYDWKEATLEKFNTLRTDTDSSLGLLGTWLANIEKFFDLKSNFSCNSCDIVLNIDNILEKLDHSVSKELEISLLEPGEEDRKIITNAYHRVVKLIFQEICLISDLKAKYLASVEFKKNMSEWINKNPNVDDLITVKKSIKGLKAQLRWKLLESSSMEESDDYNATAHADVKNEIENIRNKIFCEIQQERNEYALLSDLVQKWFPELPLIYFDAGITSYMKSGGLLSGSMERELFDAEPLKEFSSKRPLVCTHVQNQKVLLKGYSVGMDTEAQVIVRASQYHKAWLQQKEESGIMQLLYLFFCKSDPVVYLMVPFYPGESLGHIQANNKLSSYETVRVMRGVAHGLHTLHASNIIIGSLHENNVFAVNRERGMVGDFDLTRNAEQRSSATSICFPMLTAPELKLGQQPIASSDVYSYGILLLWLCTGKKIVAYKPDGTPDLENLDLDPKAKALLSGLVCCGYRMLTEHIETHEYFHIAEPEFPPLPNDDTDDNMPADFA
ncbi:serine/threonine-protein kinase 31 [Anomaloglossus baeobatrachus]|uniref:serine/threonine-protein kinase 31 n=1 Tax=Anomaloglossus baeobatrachus TaxID=238106 RepID=UPI003F5052F1